MAEGGIDRKAEERMEFTTSKEVEIGKAEPLFDAPHDSNNSIISSDRLEAPK
jgi:hypothetical protein